MRCQARDKETTISGGNSGCLAQRAVLEGERLSVVLRVAILRLLRQVIPSFGTLPVTAVPPNLPHLAGALSPRQMRTDMTYPVISSDKYRQANNGPLHLKPLSICYYKENPAPKSWHEDCCCFLPRGKPESNGISYCLTILTAF